MKKEAIRGRVERHRGSDKLILSKRFIAFLQEIRKEACAAKKKPAKPTLEKKVSPASNQNPCLLASFVIRKKSRSNVRRRPLHVYEEERRPHQDEGHGASFA